MRITKRFSTLKLASKLKKLNKNIRPRHLKYVLSSIVFITFFYPLDSYADETVNSLNKVVDKVDKNTCSSNSTSKFRSLAMSLIGLKKCLDPNITPFQKFVYCSRSCCLVAGFTSGYISEKSTVGGRIHKIASLCCACSWSTYAFLAFVDSEKLVIKGGK